MAIIRCKMCEGEVELSADKTFGICEYCGSTSTFPKFSDEQRASAFNRGNHFRRIGEFDTALSVYEQIVREDDSDAEAHWCCALCRFGIEYVEDPVTLEWLPTCHRVSFDSFLEDLDYKAALENSDGITRRQYIKDAGKIAEVQRGILATSQNTEPYDVFICYKETDTAGERTRDSVIAQDIYYRLTEQGHRVFFSRITLEDVTGTQYEPYIFAALNSAKVMLVIGTKPEYLNAVWVKNEWSRFLALMRKDRSKVLLPCYQDMDPYNMPEQLKILQSYDMRKIGFVQDLLRGVSKIVNGDKKETARKETVIVQQSPVNNVTALLKRGYIALEDGEWEKAAAFFDRVLDQDAECGEAYFGQYLVDNKLKNMEAFVGQRLQQTKAVRKEKLEIPCQSREVDAAVEKYAVAGYLNGDTIRKLFICSREYYSETRGFQNWLDQEIRYFKSNKMLDRALKYADSAFGEQLYAARETILVKIKDQLRDAEAAENRLRKEKEESYAKHLREAENKAREAYEKAVQWRETDYQAACEFMNSAKTASEFRAGSLKFEGFQGYQDSRKLAQECRQQADRLDEAERAKRLAAKAEAEKRRAEEQAETERLKAEEEARKAESRRAAAAERARRERAARLTKIMIAVFAATVIILCMVYKNVIVPAREYQTAQQLMLEEQYDDALEIFEALATKNYKDSEEYANEIFYRRADALYSGQKYEEAMKAFAALNSYRDSAQRANQAAYAHAEHLLRIRKFDAAAELFTRLRDYEDAADRAQETVYKKAEYFLLQGSKAKAAMLYDSVKDYSDAGQRSRELWDEVAVRETVSAGIEHTVCIKSDGTALAVGWNGTAQCEVLRWKSLVAVSAGYTHTVGLKSDGTVVAVGSNDFGQCNVSAWTEIVSISAGYEHTVALKADGTVVATGNSKNGECAVQDWTNIVAVSAGYQYTVGLKADGTVVAVGNNSHGQCDVGRWKDVVAIDAGFDHTVGLKKQGTALATGDNFSGECNVGEWTNLVQISAGGTHTIGITSTGEFLTAGNTWQGQCNVGKWENIVCISSGDYFTVGLKADGSVVATGDNNNGQCKVKEWKNVMLP